MDETKQATTHEETLKKKKKRKRSVKQGWQIKFRVTLIGRLYT